MSFQGKNMQTEYCCLKFFYLTMFNPSFLFCRQKISVSIFFPEGERQRGYDGEELYSLFTRIKLNLQIFNMSVARNENGGVFLFQIVTEPIGVDKNFKFF